MRSEDGVSGAVNAFTKHLPLQNMTCEVSLFLGESVLAKVTILDSFDVIGLTWMLSNLTEIVRGMRIEDEPRTM
jgi:hypothetical protein